jgi:hypothetical protein
MAIDGIGLAEPSTITKSLAAVPIERNSSVTYQEVMVLGSPNSTTLLALAEVMGSAPASTTVGLVVRVAEPSTGPFSISTVGGAVTVRSSAASALVTAYQSSAADLNVTVAGYSTTVNVSSLGGTVIVVGTVNVSSVSGSVAVAPVSGSTFRTQPGSTLWASSAGFHFDSSGALQITGASASTGVTVNRMVGNSSAVDYMPVRIVNSSGDGFVTPSLDYTHGSTLSTGVSAPGVLLRGSAAVPTAVGGDDRWVLQWATLNGAANVALVTSSGASAMDSTESALKVNVVAGSAAGSTIVTVSTGSVRVHQSSAADLNVTVAGYSTTVNVSSLGGAVIVRSSAASLLGTVYQSTASELQTTARINTSSGGAVEGSTTTPAANVTGLHIRQVYPTMQSTTLIITSTHSTAVYPVISSVAGMRHKVYAYFVGSTHTLPSTMIFCSSASDAGFDHWAVNFGSGSSGITGANLALSPPGFIFAGITANALNVKVEGGSSVTSTVVVRLAISWFDEA